MHGGGRGAPHVRRAGCSGSVRYSTARRVVTAGAGARETRTVGAAGSRQLGRGESYTHVCTITYIIVFAALDQTFV